MKTYLPLILLCLACAFALPACKAQPAQKAQAADMEARLDALERNLDRICSILEERDDEEIMTFEGDHLNVLQELLQRKLHEAFENGEYEHEIIIREKAEQIEIEPLSDEFLESLLDNLDAGSLKTPVQTETIRVKGRIHRLHKDVLSHQMRERLERIKSRLRPAQRKDLDRILRYIAAAARQGDRQLRRPEARPRCEKRPHRKDCERREHERREVRPVLREVNPELRELHERIERCKKELNVFRERISAVLKQHREELRKRDERIERLEKAVRQLKREIEELKKEDK